VHIVVHSFSEPELDFFRRTTVRLREPHRVTIAGRWDLHVRSWLPVTDGPLLDDDGLALRIKADGGISEGEWNEMWMEGKKDMRRMS
jgi:hypothetical protein